MPPDYELTACPACESPRAEEIADAEAMRAEMETLWEFHLRRVRSGTPPEHLTDRTVFSQDPPLRLARCEVCGTLYRNPRERARDLREIYAGEEPDPSVLRTLFEVQRGSYRSQARRLAAAMGPRGEGLEVGSYVGAFLAAAREVGWEFEGLDVNEPASRFARGLGFQVHPGAIEEFAPGRSYRAIAFWNCFDQLADPRAAARAARRLLAPGGVVAIRVPNGAFYTALRRRLAGPAAPLARALLAHNNLLGFPYRHGFTPHSLAHLLRVSGFEPTTVVGDTLVPVADGWTRRWAAWEERILKGTLRALADYLPPPWFEIYARGAE